MGMAILQHLGQDILFLEHTILYILPLPFRDPAIAQVLLHQGLGQFIERAEIGQALRCPRAKEHYHTPLFRSDAALTSHREGPHRRRSSTGANHQQACLMVDRHQEGGPKRPSDVHAIARV